LGETLLLSKRVIIAAAQVCACFSL
jgi:hypothetical protein